MKKILFALIIGAFTFGSIGCSGDKTKTDKTKTDKTEDKTKT